MNDWCLKLVVLFAFTACDSNPPAKPTAAPPLGVDQAGLAVQPAAIVSGPAGTQAIVVQLMNKGPDVLRVPVFARGDAIGGVKLGCHERGTASSGALCEDQGKYGTCRLQELVPNAVVSVYIEFPAGLLDFTSPCSITVPYERNAHGTWTTDVVTSVGVTEDCKAERPVANGPLPEFIRLERPGSWPVGEDNGFLKLADANSLLEAYLSFARRWSAKEVDAKVAPPYSPAVFDVYRAALAARYSGREAQSFLLAELQQTHFLRFRNALLALRHAVAGLDSDPEWASLAIRQTRQNQFRFDEEIKIPGLLSETARHVQAKKAEAANEIWGANDALIQSAREVNKSLRVCTLKPVSEGAAARTPR